MKSIGSKLAAALFLSVPVQFWPPQEKVLLSSPIHQPNLTAKTAKISHYTDGQLNLQKFPLDNSARQQEFLVKQSKIL